MSDRRNAIRLHQDSKGGVLDRIIAPVRRRIRRLRTWFKNWYWRYRIPALLWRATCGRWLFAKVALSRDEADIEISAMRFVRARTKVPVPYVWGCIRLPWAEDDECYIIMNRVAGVDLDSIWERLDNSAQDRVVDQLAPFLEEMRRLSSPYGSNICAVNGKAVVDHRLPYRYRGPYSDEQAFNHILRYFEPLSLLPPDIVAVHAISHAIVLTHGDIMPRNIMVDPATLNVTALVDWGCAGWFPTWWEYRKAQWTAHSELEEESWIPRLSRFMPTFPVEKETDDYLIRRFPP
ncbi:hypothetical protein PENSPDRAFT_740129 [Peniophora sp. CONT]|nr:hypothetical protein PENSPDRAFT_740129 [Peniophora sp. CONT]